MSQLEQAMPLASLSDTTLVQHSHESQGQGMSIIFHAKSCGQVMAKKISLCKLVLCCLPSSMRSKSFAGGVESLGISDVFCYVCPEV